MGTLRRGGQGKPIRLNIKDYLKQNKLQSFAHKMIKFYIKNQLGKAKGANAH